MSSYELALTGAHLYECRCGAVGEKGRGPEKRRENRPLTLRFKDIHIADQVFQWRIREDNFWRRISHTLGSLPALSEISGKPLDPLLVTPIGQRFYVMLMATTV